MCLIAFAWQAHPDYPLVVAANRDEYFERPTVPAAWWNGRDVLAGLDLRGGGTWMGVTSTGRFGALTNYRDPRSTRTDAPSRGLLVSDVLEHRESIPRILDGLAATASDYNGYNLIAAQWDPDPARAGLWMLQSRAATMVTRVEPGIHGLSNALLDTPWPKVERARDALRAALDDRADDLVDTLLAALADRSIASDAELPETGVSREFERALSAAFIRLPGYGTRTSTVLVIDRRGQATFVERTCEPEGEPTEKRFVFPIAARAA